MALFFQDVQRILLLSLLSSSKNRRVDLSLPLLHCGGRTPGRWPSDEFQFIGSFNSTSRQGPHELLTLDCTSFVIPKEVKKNLVESSEHQSRDSAFISHSSLMVKLHTHYITPLLLGRWKKEEGRSFFIASFLIHSLMKKRNKVLQLPTNRRSPASSSSSGGGEMLMVIFFQTPKKKEVNVGQGGRVSVASR
jgi:hypothetical protein